MIVVSMIEGYLLEYLLLLLDDLEKLLVGTDVGAVH